MDVQKQVAQLKRGIHEWNLWRRQQKQIEQLIRSIHEWNEWRRQQPNLVPYLRGTDLSGADLSGANLSGIDLSGVDLSDANLSGANLSGAIFFRSLLFRSPLSGTLFSRSHFYQTTFAWVDLSDVRGLDTAIHDGPSILDINSVVLPTNEHTRLDFLRGVGFSDTAIEYLPSILTPAAIQYHSLFIAYANPDEILARRLYQDLQNKGIRCWMAPHDLRPGDYHHSRIDEAICLHEKVLLLLSEHAVNSSWVKHEVQIVLAREIAQDCAVLFPLRLDETIMRTSKDWAVRLRESRHIGDFTGWQDESAYQLALATLLRHLTVVESPKA